MIRATHDNNNRAWARWLLALLPLPLLGCHASDTGNLAPDLALPEAMTPALFIATLDARQQAVAHRPFDEYDRTDWSYTPWEHSGLPLSELDAEQQLAALALVRNAMTEDGFLKAQQVRTLELELQRRSLIPNYIYDPNRYYTTIFGEPGEGPWSWRFEGHHLSINLTWLDDELIATTPFFIGAHPSRVDEGPYRRVQPIAFEERIARQLAVSLEAHQMQEALLSDEPPEDILTGDASVVELPCCKGVSAAGFTDRQKEFLRVVIRLIVGQFDSPLASETLARIEGDGIEDFYFAWAGKLRAGNPHYYRVQAPGFLIEYDNRGENADHTHIVWRNPENDFGRDILAEHHASHPH